MTDPLTRKLMTRTLAVQSSTIGSRLPPLKKQEDETPKSKGPNCRLCVHFFVTWERNMPYGCKAYGFKGPKMPSLVVKDSSNEDCHFFKQRS